MIKLGLIIIAVLLLAAIASAEQYTLEPRYVDLQPDDNINEAGSYGNPLIVKDDFGREIFAIEIPQRSLTERCRVR